MATLPAQDRNILEYMTQADRADREGEPAHSLAPQAPVTPE